MNEQEIEIDVIKNKSIEVATIMKHLGHPKKLIILCSLFDNSKSVGELTEICEIGQSQMSQFLKRMELEGLLASTRDGNHIYYQIIDERIKSVLNNLKTTFCAC